MLTFYNEEQRRRAIAWAIALTAETTLAPDQYESELLERYAQGKLTLDRVLHQLDTRVHHILYRSQAKQFMTNVQLTDLLEQSRAWNKQQQITGLLCYASSGHFVQLIEGPAQHVQNLYAKIRQDPRHHHVTLLSEKACDKRWFPDWQMALARAHPHDFFWLLEHLDAKGQDLSVPQRPVIDAQLITLLQKFSTT